MEAVIFKDKAVILSLIWRALRWHINYLFTRGPLPLACGLYITNRCNLRCSFCNLWRKPTPATLTLSQAKDIIDNLSSLGCFYFSITGGEPLLVDYLFDLLHYARKSKIKYLHLVTNGFLLDKEKAINFRDTGINEVSISIDGDEKLHDQFRGLPGAYNKAVQAIANLKNYAPNVQIVLNAILMPEDPDACLSVLKLAKNFAVYLKVQPLNQHPVFNRHNQSAVSGNSVQAERLKEVITKLRQEPCVVNSRAFLDNIYNFFCQRQDLILKDSYCLFGYHHLEILENGSIFPCLEGLNWQNGFNFTANLKQLIHSAPYKELLQGLKHCLGCQRSFYICYYEPRINFPLNNFLKNHLR